MGFTDDIAYSYTVHTGVKVFICLIHRANEEKLVWEDMLAQQRWHEILKPRLTSLKFRLPWPGNGLIGGQEEGARSNQIEYLGRWVLLFSGRQAPFGFSRKTVMDLATARRCWLGRAACF